MPPEAAHHGLKRPAQRGNGVVGGHRGFGFLARVQLIDAAERVCHEDFGKTSAMTLLKKKAVNGKGR